MIPSRFADFTDYSAVDQLHVTPRRARTNENGRPPEGPAVTFVRRGPTSS
jgi:hypothetical protein